VAYVVDDVESAIGKAAEEDERKDYAAKQARAFLHLLIEQA